VSRFVEFWFQLLQKCIIKTASFFVIISNGSNPPFSDPNDFAVTKQISENGDLDK
jgi:hypothetical protein